MNAFRPARYVALLLLPLAILAACGGGDDQEMLTLEDYFPRLEALFGEFESRSAAVGERFTEQFDAEDLSLSETMELVLEVLPELLAETRPINRDLVEGLERVEPPAAAADAQAELVAGYQGVRALLEDLADQLESGETDGAAAFAALFEDASATEMGERIGRAIAELEALAVANGIVVDLSAAGFSSGQALGEPVIEQGRR